MGGALACMEDWRGAYRVLVGKPEGKTQLKRPRHRREDNIKNGSLGSGMRAWTGLIWHRTETGGGLLWMRQ